MSRLLGTFVTCADARRAAASARMVGIVAAAAIAGVTYRRGYLVLGAVVVGVLVWLVARYLLRARLPRGALLLDGPEHDRRLVFAADARVLFSGSLATMQLGGRTSSLIAEEPARVQVYAVSGEQAMVANLAVAFRPAEGDVLGILPAIVEVDRDGSRALDAIARGALRPTTASSVSSTVGTEAARSVAEPPPDARP